VGWADWCLEALVSFGRPTGPGDFGNPILGDGDGQLDRAGMPAGFDQRVVMPAQQHEVR
jgi:hypothetical protein